MADFDEDGYWLECIQRSGSNSATSGWLDMVEYVKSMNGDARALSGMACALRSLSQQCFTQLSELKEAKRLEMYNGKHR